MENTSSTAGDNIKLVRKPDRPLSNEQIQLLISEVTHARHRGFDGVYVYFRGGQIKVASVKVDMDSKRSA